MFMYMKMCVCIYIYVYVLIYIYIYTYVYVYIYICTQFHADIRKYTHVYIYIHRHMPLYIYMIIHVYLHIYIHKIVSTYTHIYICVCVFIHMHVCMCGRACVYCWELRFWAYLVFRGGSPACIQPASSQPLVSPHTMLLSLGCEHLHSCSRSAHSKEAVSRKTRSIVDDLLPVVGTLPLGRIIRNNAEAIPANGDTGGLVTRSSQGGE